MDRRRRPEAVRFYYTRELDSVVTLIAQSPGMRAEDYSKASGMEPQMFKRILAKLRLLGAVQTGGTRRAMTYRLP